MITKNKILILVLFWLFTIVITSFTIVYFYDNASKNELIEKVGGIERYNMLQKIEEESNITYYFSDNTSIIEYRTTENFIEKH